MSDTVLRRWGYCVKQDSHSPVLTEPLAQRGETGINSIIDSVINTGRVALGWNGNPHSKETCLWVRDLPKRKAV